jgi:hypothetical protein
LNSDWAGRLRGFIPKSSTSLPIRIFLIALVCGAYLPIWIGSADPWWRVKEWAVLLVATAWVPLKMWGNLRVSRSGQDKWLSILTAGLLTHFFLLFVFPIVKAPSLLYQVPWPWMAFFHAMIALFWIHDLRRTITQEDFTRAFNFLAILASVLSGYMLLQYLNLDPLMWFIQRRFEGFRWFHDNHMIGLMGNPFQASAALAVIIPALAFQAFNRRGRLWKALLFLSLLVSYLAQSRVGFAAALFGSVCASGKVRTAKTWTILLVLSVLGTAALASVKPEILLDRGRLSTWSQALPHIMNHPFLGVGLNQFKLLNIIDPVPPGYAVRWAHNEWVHFSTELGIPFALFLAVYLTREAVKLSRIHRGMFGCFVSALLLSFFHIPFHLAPVLAVLGIGLVVSHLDPNKELSFG